MKDIKINILKESILGKVLIDLKDLSLEISSIMWEFASTPKGNQSWHRKNIYNNLYRYYKKGYFDISKENNKTFFTLSLKGKKLVELLKFCTGKLKWDGKWRVLIFDIPEKEKAKRERLRIQLKELGFVQLQQSVWITPYPLPNSFSSFLAELRVRPYLYSMTVDNINRERELKEFFGLSGTS